MWIWQKTEDSSFSQKFGLNFWSNFGYKTPYPPPLQNYFQFFRDILLASNILGILTRGIVETIFLSILHKKRGRGGGIHTHTRPQYG